MYFSKKTTVNSNQLQGDTMKLLDIIDYLRRPERLQDLYDSLKLSKESESISIYMKDAIDINSDLEFFEIEKTDGKLIYELNGTRYIELFPLEYASDIICNTFSEENRKLNNVELSKRILEYRINDA